MGNKGSKNKKAAKNNAFVYNGDPIPSTPMVNQIASRPMGKQSGHRDTINANLFKKNNSLASSTDSSFVNKYTSLRQLTEIIIFGFVRTHCHIALEKTPQDIVNLCLLFYTLGDEWDTSNSDSRLVHDEGQIIISKAANDATISRYYAFGRDTCQRGQKRLWRFKVIHRDDSYKRVSISLGIIPRSIINQQSFDMENNNDYLYDDNRYKLMFKNGKISNGKTITHYCAPIQVHDVIDMELDMTNSPHSTLSYWINDIPQGVAFDKIQTKGAYYALCASFERRDKLQIVPTFSKQRSNIL